MCASKALTWKMELRCSGQPTNQTCASNDAFCILKTTMAPGSVLCSTNVKFCDCFAQNAHDCSWGQCKESNIRFSFFSLVDRPTKLFAKFVLIYKFKRHSRSIFWLLIVLEFNLAIQASRSRGSWVNLSPYWIMIFGNLLGLCNPMYMHGALKGKVSCEKRIIAML